MDRSGEVVGVRREDQRRDRLLREVEFRRQIPQQGDIFADGRAGSGQPSVLGSIRAPPRKPIFDGLQVGVERERLMVDVSRRAHGLITIPGTRIP